MAELAKSEMEDQRGSVPGSYVVGAGAGVGIGAMTPPASEDGRCHSVDLDHFSDVNNPTTTSTSTSRPASNSVSSISSITTAATTPPNTPPKSRRNRLSLQKEREANRSKQFTTRQQRSASEASQGFLERETSIRGNKWRQPSQRNSLGSDPGEEKVNGQEVLKTKMAYAEQQQWITVQQKTFTKW